MLAFMVQGLVLGFPAAVQPGPLQAYFLGAAVKNGWRRTVPAALAPLLSDGPIVALVLLVLTQLPPTLLVALRVSGGIFLIILAWRAWRDFRHFRPNPAPNPTDAATRRSVLHAAFLNLLNPNPYIFWSTVSGPLLLDAWAQSPGHALAFLFGFYGTLVGMSAAFIVAAGTVGALGNEGRFGRILTLLSAVGLFLFGCFHLWRALAGAA